MSVRRLKSSVRRSWRKVVAKVLPAGNLQAWMDKLIAAHEVFAPVKSEGASSFKQVTAGRMPDFNIVTDMPPKGLIFRQVEKILSYKDGEDGMSINEELDGQVQNVILGIRPCDTRSFDLIDKVFLDPNMPEHHYAMRRKQTALVTLACDKACRTCFCTSVGGSPVDKVGDIWMINLGDRFLVEALSPAGEDIIAAGADLFTGATADDETAAKRIGDEVVASMPRLQIPSAQSLEDLFADETFWKTLSEKCLSCGACTFSCPTCYCFDVRDEGSVQSGDRYRRWDSCMFFQYSRAAGGHNPRSEHWKRMRQRMLHKFCFYVESYDAIGCVGCGRCIRGCPVSYDLRDFLEGGMVASAGAKLDFTDELPGEDENPRTCDVKPVGETTKTGVESDG